MTTTPNWFESRKRSVDNLQRIFSFVVSLAVAEALRRTLTSFPSPEPAIAPFNTWMHLFAILATLVPFYHGASRYLDAAYVTGERTSVKYALIVDFLFLFAESIIFFALALLIADNHWFYLLFAFLLVVDVVWVCTTVFTTRTEACGNQVTPSIGRWAVLNVITILIILSLYWSNISTVTIWHVAAAPAALLAMVALLRSVLDYRILWNFYYPEKMIGQK